MSMLNKKRKKGFTLVEVIIVLAIIAIIAAIAIPNLTKVRTESKIKADTQSAETIRKSVIMLITEDTIKVNDSNDGVIIFKDLESVTTGSSTGKITGVEVSNIIISPGKGDASEAIAPYFEGIKMPQADGATGYTAKIKTDGNVEVSVDGTSPLIEVK